MNMPKKMKVFDTEKCLKNMEEATILVVGDIMLDRFVYGSVERISPESPVPVLSISRETAMLGGAGNALANLAGLRVHGKMLSVIGNDENGIEIRKLAKELNINTDGLLIDDERPSIVKTRYLAGHQQLLRSDFERKQPLSPAKEKALLQKAKELTQDCDALIISDYGKGLLNDGIIRSLIKLGKAKNIPVLVDPKGLDYARYKGASVITPNKKELAEATGLAVESDQDIAAAAQKLIKQSGVEAVVATRSRDGMSVVGKKGVPVHLRTKDIEVFDVSGAGDTVIATVAAAMAAGAQLSEAAQLANLAASIVVSKVGTAPIRSKELRERLRGGDNAAPLCEMQEATENAQRWSAKGLKVGFTNGCFDVLHAGHTSYLAQARKKCDRLVVGLNCDQSVKILKGSDRPVHDENSRAAVLAALSSVDMVVLFGAQKEGEDNTASALIEKLQPDFYFKGGDYTENQIPEASAVKAHGGEVCIMPFAEGHSTSASIAKIRDKAA